MDKRTLLFVIILTLALFGVNMYFEQGRHESLQQWSEQQKAKQLEKKQKLEQEISQFTVSPSKFPSVSLYEDAAATRFVTTGLLVDDNILTLSWNTEIPQTIFVKKQDDSTPAKEYTLSFFSHEMGEPILFSQANPKPLSIGNLPDFGTLYLQMITPSNITETPPFTVQLGNYQDGHFTPLQQQLEQLNKAVNESSSVKPLMNAIVLMKSADKYLPVGYYNAPQHRLVYLDEIEGLKTILQKPENGTTTAKKTEEKFYVLESPYQQLVFSNFGGALAEINLPFQTKENTQSVVKEIEFDRQIAKDHPYNAHFPSHSYYLPNDKAEHPPGPIGGYYPLIRRDLIESSKRHSVRIQPRYYALNIVSEYPEVAELVYEVKQFDDKSIVLESTQSHRRITKTFSLEPNEKLAPYCINLTINIEGDSRGLWLTSGVPEVEWISGTPAPALKYRITRNKKATVENLDLPQDNLTVTSVYPDWICDSNGFLGMIMDSLSKIDPGYRAEYIAGTIVPSRLLEIESDYGRFKAQDLPGYMMMLPLKSTGGSMTFRVFAGPFAEGILKRVDATYTDPVTGENPDYLASQTFHGFFAFISEPFAKFLFILMKFFYDITHSWALSIVLLTIALRIMMYPLNAWSSKSMVKMQQIGPEVALIQEKYKKDPKMAQLEVMNLYRERGVNPVSGCLPLLIQMPFLIGMFDLLKSTFELRGASFIPGWIDDLSAPDVLFSWTTPIFFIGNQFHLLPIILGGVMFLQQRLSSTAPTDPKLMTDQQRQQKAMGTIMSVVFTFMFYNFPSGLNIYWLSSMLLGMLQQWTTARKMQAATAAATVKATVVQPPKKTGAKKV